MSDFAASALIDRPIEEVWSFISDPMSAAMWGRGVSDVVVISKGPIGLGTTLGLNMSGSPMQARIVEFAAGTTFTLEFTSGPVKGSRLTYAVEAAGDKTILSTDLEMRVSGLWMVFYPILARRRKKDREWGVANVKRILEGQTSKPA